MSTRKNSTTFPWFFLVVLAILAVGSGGAFRNVAVVVAIVVVFMWLRNVSTAAGRAAGRPAPGEVVVPGGRSMDEVMREAAETAPEAPAAPPIAPVAITPAPITPSTPVGAPTVRPDQDVRSGATAPDVLTGAETLPPGTLAEGWYVTADGRRERWWNGASWTAHVRERDAEG